MIAIVGTVPETGFPLVSGTARLQGGHLIIDDRKIDVNRGTPALVAAAITACMGARLPEPFVFLVGDIGLGDGSRRLYEHLSRHLGKMDFRVICFHYLQPDVDWHNRVLFAVEEMARKPILMADAGFMYAAKMSGQAEAYDVFTPDVGEMAFLADEEAPHPFYTRGFILHETFRVPEMIERAYKHGNAARFLLVKGEKDYVADREGIRAVIDHPSEEALEAIGGTGDTLAGIATALVGADFGLPEALILAAYVNRVAGSYAKPNPATQVMEIIHHISDALTDVFKDKEKRLEAARRVRKGKDDPA